MTEVETTTASSTVPLQDMPREFEKRLRKPPYTYTDLITQALKDRTALTVSGIYNWIT